MVKIEIVPSIKEKMNENWDYVDKVIKGKINLKKKERTILVTPEIFSKIFFPCSP